MLEKYLQRTEFTSYDDFMQNFKINVPEDFNFGFDIVDEWARLEPDKLALLWCDDHGGERRFTFDDSATIGIASDAKYRYVIIPRGTTGAA